MAAEASTAKASASKAAGAAKIAGGKAVRAARAAQAARSRAKAGTNGPSDYDAIVVGAATTGWSPRPTWPARALA
jgi:hypothetical protein